MFGFALFVQRHMQRLEHGVRAEQPPAFHRAHQINQGVLFQERGQCAAQALPACARIDALQGNPQVCRRFAHLLLTQGRPARLKKQQSSIHRFFPPFL